MLHHDGGHRLALTNWIQIQLILERDDFIYFKGMNVTHLKLTGFLFLFHINMIKFVPQNEFM